MTSSSFNAYDIAQFLAENPDFFQQHSAIFSELRVPHPHEKKAISLGERQILNLRARNKELERQLQRLISHAKNNQQIGEQLHQWSCRMLAEPSADQLSGHIIRSLTEVFDLDSIAIRTWGVLESEHDDVNDESTGFISGLNQPYCGPASSQPVLGWLSEPVGSVAIVPLTVLSDCAGAIVMGSHQSDRFTEDMEIDFLVMIGELCASALSRVPLSPELEA